MAPPTIILSVMAHSSVSVKVHGKETGATGILLIGLFKLVKGVLLVAVGIFFYGLGVLDLVQLAAAAMVYWTATLTYTFVSIFFAPKMSGAIVAKGNPFAPAMEKKGAVVEETKETLPPPAA